MLVFVFSFGISGWFFILHPGSWRILFICQPKWQIPASDLRLLLLMFPVDLRSLFQFSRLSRGTPKQPAHCKFCIVICYSVIVTEPLFHRILMRHFAYEQRYFPKWDVHPSFCFWWNNELSLWPSPVYGGFQCCVGKSFIHWISAQSKKTKALSP